MKNRGSLYLAIATVLLIVATLMYASLNKNSAAGATNIWRAAGGYNGDGYFVEHIVGGESTRYYIQPPVGEKFKEDADPLNGLEVLDVKDSTLVLLGATGRLYAYNTSTRGLFLLVDGIQSYKYQPEEKKVLFCDANHVEYAYDWGGDPGGKPTPTERRAVSYMDDNFELETIGQGKWEFQSLQRRRLGHFGVLPARILEDEPSWYYGGIEYNTAVKYYTSLHLPKQWRLNKTIIDIGLNLVYVAHSDKVTTYHYGEVVNEYPLPYVGRWRIIRGVTEFRGKGPGIWGIDADENGIETTAEVRNAIVDESILLVSDDTHEAWAILDGEVRLLAEDVRDYGLHRGRPDWTGDHAVSFYWMDSEEVARELRWKEKDATSVVLGKEAIGISKDRPGFLVPEDDPRWDVCLGGQYIVTIPKGW